MNTATHRRFLIAVLAAMLLHVTLVAWAGPGFESSDDEVYARAAHQLATGTFEAVAEHRWNRFGVIVPTAAAFRLFGVTAWSTISVSLFWSLTGIVAVALVARRLSGSVAGATAAFLVAPMTMVVNASAFLMPDHPVGVQMFIASACVWLGRDTSVRRPAAWGVGAALAITLGVLTKLTALWLAPLFLVFFVADLAGGRHRGFWGAFALAGAVAGAAFFCTYGLATGDPLYRMHAIDARHTATHWGYGDDDAATLLARITWEPAVLILNRLPELGLVLAAAIPAMALSRKAHAGSRFWAAHTIVVAGGFWLGSTSLSEYSPLPPLPRMLSPMVLPVAVLAGSVLTRSRSDCKTPWASAAVLAAGVATGLAVGRPLAAVAYVAGTAALALALSPGAVAARVPDWTRRSALPAILTLMCVYGIVRGGVGESPRMRAERDVAMSLAARLGPHATIAIDRRSRRTLEHYAAYRPRPGAITLWDWSRREESELPRARPIFAYVHSRRIVAKKGRYSPPDWLAPFLERGEVVFDDGIVQLRRLDFDS